LKELEGGCQVPVAAHGRLDRDMMVLTGMVAELDGSVLIKDDMRGDRGDPEHVGIELARKLLASGADKILARIYGRG